MLQIIKTKCELMASMIDDFMRLSRLRHAPLRVALVDSNTIVLDVILELLQEFPAANRIVIHPLPSFEGDTGRIRQVWINLLSNALKLTGRCEDPQIRVSGEESDGMVHFHVADNGAGFDMALSDRLFTPFQRLHAEHHYEGRGIGLATVASVIDRHGGRLSAEAKLGEGATFRFSVPRMHVHDVMPGRATSALDRLAFPSSART